MTPLKSCYELVELNGRWTGVYRWKADYEQFGVRCILDKANGFEFDG